MEVTKPKTKKPTPQERWGQLVNGRLSDKQLFDLFDDFGLAKRLQTREDYDWVKHNLPNVPEQLKKILKFEADKENNLRKEQEKARANKIKEEEAANKARMDAIKNNQQPNQQPDNIQPNTSHPRVNWNNPSIRMSPQTKANPSTGTGGDGQGGPAATTAAPTGLQGYSATTSPNYSLVKFTADPNGPDEGDATTVWLVDHATKTFRPIMSMQALQDIYPGDQNFQSALNSISIMNPTALQPGGLMANFMDLGADYGVYEGGVKKDLDFNPADLTSTSPYGKARSQEATLSGVQAYDSFMKFLQSPDSGINSAFLNTVANDKNLASFYINALGYGGYTPDDVYKDIKRRELINQGDASLQNTTVISTNINRDQFVNTNPGRLAQSLPSITPPAKIGNISRDVWSSTAAALSDEYYNLADPSKYDRTSQVYRDNVEKIKTDMYDYVLQALETGKESDAIAADAKWQSYKSQAEKLLGYKLSDSALAAWRQLEKLGQTQAEAGLAGSGLAAEEQDKSLRDYREKDKREREATAVDLTDKEATQARASYSPAQIQATIAEDRAKGLPMEQWRAYKWGLVPQGGQKNFSSFLSEYRTNYPDSQLSDNDVKGQIYDNLYDENGNTRSTLYQNYQNNVSKTKYGFDFNSIPTTSQAQYKENAYQQQLADAEDALQKTSLKLGDADYWNPTKGNALIDYGDPALKGTAAAATADTAATNAEAKRQAEDKANIARAAAANAAAKMSTTAPAGKTYIPNVESMKNYTDITAPDANKKIYGVLKTPTTPASTPAAPANPWAAQDPGLRAAYERQQKNWLGSETSKATDVKNLTYATGKGWKY